MPRLFVFAIGGTGERVLRSLTMVLASGARSFDNYEVYPIIIDYDQNNEDKNRTVKLLQNYAKVNRSAFGRHGQGNDRSGQTDQFFASRLRNMEGLENYVFPFIPARANEKFREHIGYDNLAGDTIHTGELLTSIYDESDRADTELNLDMTVGFKGNPNIGSVVFHTINETPEFLKFKSLFKPQNGDKVVIIGSLFGGTGASGIPEIVKAIDNMHNPQAKIGVIMVLPYFHPMVQIDGAIQASRFNSKTKAAISFYKDSQLMGKIDKTYYVGDPYPTVIPYCEGGRNQRNNANLVELIAAMMIEHYVSGRGGNHREFKFSLDANIVVASGEKSGDRLYIKDFDDTSKQQILNHLVQLAIGLKYFHEDIQTKKAASSVFYSYLELDRALATPEAVADTTEDPLRDLCFALDSFYKEYQEWLKELDFEGNGDSIPANSHRFALCDMTKDYPDIMLKGAHKSEDGSSQGGFIEDLGRGIKKLGVGKGTKLTAGFLLTRMNYHIGPHYNTDKNQLYANHEPEWVLADILHTASVDGFMQLTNQKANNNNNN